MAARRRRKVEDNVVPLFPEDRARVDEDPPRAVHTAKTLAPSDLVDADPVLRDHRYHCSSLVLWHVIVLRDGVYPAESEFFHSCGMGLVCVYPSPPTIVLRGRSVLLRDVVSELMARTEPRKYVPEELVERVILECLYGDRSRDARSTREMVADWLRETAES